LFIKIPHAFYGGSYDEIKTRIRRIYPIRANGPGPVAHYNRYGKIHRNQFQQHVLKVVTKDALLDTIFDHTYIIFYNTEFLYERTLKGFNFRVL
jgi:hypothetical protein